MQPVRRHTYLLLLVTLRTLRFADALRRAHSAETSNTSSDTFMKLEEFTRVCHDVEMDIVTSKGALKRVFDNMDYHSKGEGHDGWVDVHDVSRAMKDGPDGILLQTLVDTWYMEHILCDDKVCNDIEEIIEKGCTAHCFSVAEDYDFTKGTTDNYKSITEPEFFGLYKDIRETQIDYNYHAHFTMERQLWQDEYISRVVDRAPGSVGSPWLIFTSGGMGVGKGYVMEWISNQNLFTHERFVFVNPDYFKGVMPEYKLYTAAGQPEGTMCHKESNLMDEIAQSAALRKNKHVFVDGSLRDSGWYVGTKERPGLLPRLKKQYPHYKIAVLHVQFGSLDDVEGVKASLQRQLDKRAAGPEGRTTPFDLAFDSIQQSENTVELLREAGITDFMASINNVWGQAPRVQRVAVPGEADGQWQDMSSVNDEYNKGLKVQWKSSRESIVENLENQEFDQAMRRTQQLEKESTDVDANSPAWHYIRDRFSPDNLLIGNNGLPGPYDAGRPHCEARHCPFKTVDMELRASFPYMVSGSKNRYY